MTTFEEEKQKNQNEAASLRLHKLANLGGLVVIAGLGETDPALLLGALIELAERLSRLSLPQLDVLDARGVQTLRERRRKKPKRDEKNKKNVSQPSRAEDDFGTEFSLPREVIHKMIIKLGGRIPVLKKDLIPELLRLLR